MRQRKQEEENTTGNWLNTYADMITLVLTFFVLLFSFSTLDRKKLEAFVSSLPGNRFQTGINVDPNATSLGFPDLSFPEVTPEATPDVEDEQFDQLYAKIYAYVMEKNLAADVFVHEQEKGILLRFSDKILFDSGEAELKDNAYKILEDIGLMLHALFPEIDIIRVEGHTDNVPIQTSQYPSNWELSAARAVAVVRYYIEEKEMDPLKFSATGYGEYRPIAPNDTAANRQLNRRVDIFIERKMNGQ